MIANCYDFSNQKEIEIIKSILNKDTSISIDLGANVGEYTKVLAEHSKHVYAFEPEPINFSQLIDNTKSFDNVTLFNYAASNETGFQTLHLSNINNGMHRLYESEIGGCGDKIQVRTVSIDDLGLPKIDLIKMDVEGFEYYVTIGMSELILRDKPVIISEFHPDSIRESNADPEDLCLLMLLLFDYNYPKHCITGEVLDSYEKLEQTTNDPKGGVNILWEPNK